MNTDTTTQPAAKSAPHMTQLREHLLGTLADLRDRERPMEPDRARAVAQVASVLVDTAKVEVDYLKASGQSRAGFLEEPPAAHVAHLGRSSAIGDVLVLPGDSNGITSITQHSLRG